MYFCACTIDRKGSAPGTLNPIVEKGNEMAEISAAEFGILVM
jgi:hypothetical protein